MLLNHFRILKFALKKYHLYIFLVLIIYSLPSCVSTTKIEILHPAAITLPKYIDTIGIINRVIPRDNNNSTLSQNSCAYGDVSSFNLETSDSCIKALFYNLGNSPRFKDIDITDELVRDGTDFFPPPMDSGFVKEACWRYKIQALSVLEEIIVHSDISTQRNTRQVPYTTSYRDMYGSIRYRTQYRTEYYYTAYLNVFYSIGFRIYGNDGSILDEYRFDNSYYTSRTNSSSNYAVNNLPNRYHIIRMIANNVGDVYAKRISPMWGLEKRNYFTNPNKNFIAAHDSINNNNWHGAKEIWTRLYQNGKQNQKGLAAYNLALACEVEDNLDLAMQWANDAKIIFQKRNNYDHLKSVNNYMEILNKRLSVRQMIIEQMNHD